MKTLGAILGFGVLTAWVPAQWAWRAVECMLFLLAAWMLWRRRLRLRRSPWVVVLGGAAAWATVQFAARSTIYPWETYNARLTWMAWLCAYLISENACAFHRAARPWLLRAITLFSVVLAFVAILQRFTGGGRIFWLFDAPYAAGAMGPWVYPNQYAAFVLLALPVALWESRGWTLAGPALLVASVLVSGSLAGSVLVCAEAAILLLIRARDDGWQPLGVAVAAAALIIAVTGWDALAAKFARDAPMQVRMNLLGSTVDMARERPWMGSGLGTWYVAYPRFAHFDDGVFDNQAHNDWAQWAAEGGVPFFALMLLMAVAASAAAWRTPWALGLALVLVHCLIEYHFQERAVFGALYFALAGTTRVMHNRE